MKCFQVHEIKCEEDGMWSQPFKRCKSPMVGQCPKPLGSHAVLLVCEDYYPGGVCKAECKSEKYHFFEEVSYIQHPNRLYVYCALLEEWWSAKGSYLRFVIERFTNAVNEMKNLKSGDKGFNRWPTAAQFHSI